MFWQSAHSSPFCEHWLELLLLVQSSLGFGVAVPLLVIHFPLCVAEQPPFCFILGFVEYTFPETP